MNFGHSVIDAHQHFWNRSLTEFDYSWQDIEGMEKIRRDFLPADLKPALQAAGVDKTILVQTQHNVAENRWALALAESHDWIAGVVGWVDLTSVECESQLDEFSCQPKFIGVRHVVQDEPDDDFIIRADVWRGLAILEKQDVAFDLLFYAKHLKHAATVAQRFPNLRLVIDHLAKPPIKSGQIDTWRDDLAAAAKCKNVFCKLSGMVTEGDWKNWKPSDFRPYVDAALDYFGPQRCLFGSDWPVCELAASYQQVFEALVQCIGEVSVHERAQIMGGSASDFYRLGRPK